MSFKMKFKPMYLIYILLIFLAIPFLLLFKNHYSYNKKQAVYREQFLQDSSNELPSFEELTLEGHLFFEGETTMPFMDVKVFYPYNDERLGLFVTGGETQKNKVYLYEDGTFKDIASQMNLEGYEEAAYSMIFADIDNDGLKEVVVGYASGIYKYNFNNNTQTYEEAVKIADLPDTTIPHDISFADTRKSGFQDLFVSTFVDFKHFKSAIYHDSTNKRANLFLVNNGDGTFTNKINEAGLGIVENTYLSKFVDFNNNGLPDLVLALNTNVGFIHENLGDGKFKPHKLPIDYGFWMGLSVEKISEENDNYHILMSNVGNSFPAFLLRGDLEKEEKFQMDYVLLEQVKDFEFKDVTFEKNIYSNVFGWGVVLSDLNNNGRKDAILTENYIKFPGKFHKSFPSEGKVFMQHTNGTFAEMHKELKVTNPHFGYRVLTHDITGNGYQDIIIGNVDGPIKIFLNKGVK